MSNLALPPIRNYQPPETRFAEKGAQFGNPESANRGPPLPLGRGVCKTNPKTGASDPEEAWFLAFSVFGGGLGPWSQIMVSEAARPILVDISAPRKKYLAPPPPCAVPGFTADTLPAPRPLPSWRPPPLLGFWIKNRPPPPRTPPPPSPAPRTPPSVSPSRKNKNHPERPPSWQGVGVDPETLTEAIRENQAIRANLRIDSHESGHLSWTSSLTRISRVHTPTPVHQWRA